MYKYATDTFSIIIMLERTRKGNTVLHDYVRLIVFHIACFKSLLERVNLVIANISFDPLVLWFAEDNSLPLALSAHLKVFNVLLPGAHLPSVAEGQSGFLPALLSPPASPPC